MILYNRSLGLNHLKWKNCVPVDQNLLHSLPPIKCFQYIYQDDHIVLVLYSINMVHYINLLLNVKLTLHSWDKATQSISFVEFVVLITNMFCLFYGLTQGLSLGLFHAYLRRMCFLLLLGRECSTDVLGQIYM